MSIKTFANVTIRLIGPDGKLKREERKDNLVVTAGKVDLASFLSLATAISYMNFLALGTGASEAQLTDTALEAEIGTRVAATSSASSNVLKKTGTFLAGNGTGTIREVGLFDQAGLGGTMFARNAGFSPFVKGGGDIMEITWEIHFD